MFIFKEWSNKFNKGTNLNYPIKIFILNNKNINKKIEINNKVNKVNKNLLKKFNNKRKLNISKRKKEKLYLKEKFIEDKILKEMFKINFFNWKNYI